MPDLNTQIADLRQDLGRVARAAMSTGGLSSVAREILAEVAGRAPAPQPPPNVAVDVLRLLVDKGLVYEDGDGEWWTEQCCNDHGIAFTDDQRELLSRIYDQARGIVR